MNGPLAKLVPLSLVLRELQRMDGPDAQLVPLPCGSYSEWMVQTLSTSPCLAGVTANGWSRCSDRSPVPGPLTLTAPTKYLYLAYHRSFSGDYAVLCRAKPDKAGGWGCNPHTENTRCVQFCAGPYPNETERNQTKRNEKEERYKRKPKV